jgi:hypothetical protein
LSVAVGQAPRLAPRQRAGKALLQRAGEAEGSGDTNDGGLGGDGSSEDSENGGELHGCWLSGRVWEGECGVLMR